MNNGMFDLRHFADTNGDGVRDTLRVAISDLGGPDSTFENNGTLALAGGPGGRRRSTAPGNTCRMAMR